MKKIILKHPSGAEAEIYDYGAHLTRWRSASGREWIFTSRNAVYQEGKAIRGGVPIIFPQFNAFGSGPRHGFARTAMWHAEEVQQEKDITCCRFTLQSSAATLAVWPHQFSASFEVQLQPDALRMILSINNTDIKPLQFTAALHTYFSVNNFPACTLHNLQGKSYWDNGNDFSIRHVCKENSLHFNDAIDRMVFDVKSPLELHDGESRLHIEQRGFSDVVVWNPGVAGAKALSDMADDEYQRMLCVEAVQVDRPVLLAPGDSWQGEQWLKEIDRP
jgi:glucose-6-phosphate 1-epimerase